MKHGSVLLREEHEMWQRVLTRGGGSDEDKGIARGRNRPCFALVSAEQSTLEIVWT